MQSSSTSSRSRISQISRPESGLAEWTSKIKAMQRQLDADEEAEQKKLEDEIAASRLARLRRSHGLNYSSAQLDKINFGLPIGSLNSGNQPSNVERTSQPSGAGSREGALQTLTGVGLNLEIENSCNKVEQIGAIPNARAIPSTGIRTTSLASFLGSKETNQQSTEQILPQQHEPAEFGLLKQKRHSASEKGQTSVSLSGINDAKEPRAPGRQQSRERVTSIPPVGRWNFENAERSAPVAVPQRSGGSRTRTISTPTGNAPLNPARTSTSNEEPAFINRDKHPSSRFEAGDKLKSPLSGQIAIPIGLNTPPLSFSRSQVNQVNISIALATPPTRKSPIVVPSLARPAVAESKAIPQGPQTPPSLKPSPAFLRPPSVKDPTPSLSRLKGRGFVQNMVKVSSHLESASHSPGSPTSKGPSPRRSVLDRWQPTTTKPPVHPAVKQDWQQRSRTFDPQDTSPSIQINHSPAPSVQPEQNVIVRTEPYPKARAQTQTQPREPSLPDEDPQDVLGSSTTVLSYINPTKTGDDPMALLVPAVTEAPPLVDEFGNRVDPFEPSAAIFGPAAKLPEKLAMEAKPPLLHPTRDRARKPKKAKELKSDLASPGSLGSYPGYGQPQELQRKSSPTKQLRSQSSGRDDPPFDQRRPSLPSTHKLSAEKPQVGERDSRNTKPPPRVSRLEKSSEKSLPHPREHSWSETFGNEQGIRPCHAAEKSSNSDSGRSQKSIPTIPSPLGSKDNTPPPKTGLDGLGHGLPPGGDGKNSPGVTRHSRIPSTGNRATVMDVAQSFSQMRAQSPVTDVLEKPPEPEGKTKVRPTPMEGNSEEVKSEVAEVVQESVSVVAGNRVPRPPTASAVQNERRRSNYEKYSSIMLPPLKEEKTPDPTPAGSILYRGKVEVNEKGIDVEKLQKNLNDVLNNGAGSFSSSTQPIMVHFKHADKPLPNFDITLMAQDDPPTQKSDANILNISTELLSIIGSNAVAVPAEPVCFYETETVVVINRIKDKSAGLVSTNVWLWQGKQCQKGGKETKKANDLAKRYGATLKATQQYSEPSEFVDILGGQLAIRQGTRAHWTPENTSMHLIRSYRGNMFIDEHDLNVQNLCSGYSYCLTILDALYVWYGRGSLPLERSTALAYAQSLTSDPSNITELTEGDDDGDEMFWMILGEDNFASADYWRWRPTSKRVNPRVWKVDASNPKDKYLIVGSILAYPHLQSSVYIIDSVWEFFVLVGKEARGKRQEIRLAVSMAKSLSNHVAEARPYKPTVHVLILPTRIPLDLRLTFRDMHEKILNEGQIPDHMNLLSYDDALNQLQQSSWEGATLQNLTKLPLGLGPLDVDSC